MQFQNQSLLLVIILNFDLNVIGCEFYRIEILNLKFKTVDVLDTCSEQQLQNYVSLKGGRGGKFKLPTLTELYSHFF